MLMFATVIAWVIYHQLRRDGSTFLFLMVESWQGVIDRAQNKGVRRPSGGRPRKRAQAMKHVASVQKRPRKPNKGFVRRMWHSVLVHSLLYNLS